jgi:hypothetical protein
MLTWIHYSYGEIDDSLPSPPLYIDLKTRLNTSTSHSELQPELHNIAPIDQLNGRIDFEKRERRKRRSNEGLIRFPLVYPVVPRSAKLKTLY